MAQRLPDFDPAPDAPAEFVAAVEALRRARLRPEVVLEVIPPPQRLAPWTYAVAAEVVTDGDAQATGRLVLLCDPDGEQAWNGTLRLVSFASAELDDDMVGDPLLAEVGWSWLMEALEEHGASHTAAGGTVTQTSSVRFGDIAGPSRTVEIELRASWTPTDAALGPHLTAWAELLCTAAGLPPPGVVVLPKRGAVRS